MGARHVRLPGRRIDGVTRRLLARLLGGLAFGAPLAVREADTIAGKRRKKRRRKKQTPDGNQSPTRVLKTLTFTKASAITIPAGAPGTTEGKASPYPSIINVAGFTNGRILDVNVILHGFSHEDPNDVNVLLVATQLQNNDALFMGGVGGTTNVQNLTMTFSDQAAASLPTPLVGGTFKPTNFSVGNSFPTPAPEPSGNVALDVFNNGNPNGTWQLWVADDSSTGTGTISGGWSLQITAEVDA